MTMGIPSTDVVILSLTHFFPAWTRETGTFTLTEMNTGQLILRKVIRILKKVT